MRTLEFNGPMAFFIAMVLVVFLCAVAEVADSYFDTQLEIAKINKEKCIP